MAERWVKVAAAPDESVALLMDGVLKDAGIPSLIQRAAGFDAPDFLSAGPRDVLVPCSPGMKYEEKEIVLEVGESVLFYSDGLAEAHDPNREMFGFPRLQGLVGAHREGGSSLIGFLLSELTRFTGEGWEQEDDITLVTLERSEKP